MKTIVALPLFVLSGFGLFVLPARAEFNCETEDPPTVIAWKTEKTAASATAVPSVLRIVVPYDDAALAKYGGDEIALLNWIRSEVALLNTTLTATKAPAWVVFAGAQRFPNGFDSNVSSQELLTWTKQNPQIAAFRDQRGAVFVHYVTGVDNRGVAAFFSGHLDGGFSIGSMGLGTLAHEVGHNFGLRHNKENDPICAPACGYFFKSASGTWIIDRMSYSACNALGLPASECHEASREAFSNPNVMYDGIPTGVSGVADAVSVIAQNAPVLASLAAPASGACEEDDILMCLQNRRFAVWASWKTADGTTGFGKVTRLTADTGYVWFFGPDNVEITIKVLDACGLNNHFWVFAAGMTDVEVHLLVVDTITGAQEEYINPQGHLFVPVAATTDATKAFNCS